MPRLTASFLVLAANLCAQAPAPLTVVNAASFRRDSPLSGGMIAAAFSPAISAGTSYQVFVGESAAAMIAAAAGQITFVAPPAVPEASAVVSVRQQDRVIASTTVRTARVSPGIFTANASGSGAPAGFVVRGDGEAPLFHSAGAAFLARPFDIRRPGQTFLVLYGTGIRGWRDAATATLGGHAVPVAVAVAHRDIAGLDQVNIGPLPNDFGDRRGEMDVVVTLDGVAGNAVTVAANGPGLGEWGARAELLEANSELAVGELNGRVFVLGGYPASRQTKDTVQVYDPATDRWEIATPLPIPLNHNMAATVNGKLYMIGGQLTDGGAGNFSDRVFEYDPAARQWRERARMPTARGAGVAVALDGKIYVAGSRPPRGADFAVYDPAADSWRTLPDLPTQRNHLAGAAINGKIYIVGGRFEAGFQSPQTDAVEIFDPATNQWSRGAAMPRPRGGVNGLAANGCLHVFGGEGNPTGPNNLYPDHDVYNPVTNAWTRLGPMPIPVHGVTGAVFLHGLIHLPGGGTAQGGNSGGLQHQVFRPDMVCR